MVTSSGSLAAPIDRSSSSIPTFAESDHGVGQRVLIIVQNLPVKIDRRVWQECQALIASGYQVAVICPRGPADPPHEVVGGVSIWTYPGAPQTKGVFSYVYEFVYCWLRTLGLSVVVARRHGFDVIQACNPPDTYWALALCYKVFGKKYVFDHHDLCPEVFRSRFHREDGLLLRLLLLLERANQKVADQIIVTNESYRRIAVTRGKQRPADVTVVRSGPDPDVMKRGEPRPELHRGRPHLACYLGVMGPQDGVDQLVEAIDYYVNGMGRTDCSFALLGFGDCLEDLTAQVGRLGLEPWVEFTGRADDKMINDYLSTADIGLSPDPRSPLNELSTMNKTLEYMAYELPVVAFDLVETRVSAGEAAVYADSDDVKDYAKAIAELIDDPERRAKLGALGRARISNELSWKHSARRYVDVYDRLLGSSRALRNSGRRLPRQGA